MNAFFTIAFVYKVLVHALKSNVCMRQRTHLHHTPTFEVDYKELGLRYKQKVTTVEAQFSGHKFSGKPRFKGHFFLENMGYRF